MIQSNIRGYSPRLISLPIANFTCLTVLLPCISWPPSPHLHSSLTWVAYYTLKSCIIVKLIICNSFHWCAITYLSFWSLWISHSRIIPVANLCRVAVAVSIVISYWWSSGAFSQNFIHRFSTSVKAYQPGFVITILITLRLSIQCHTNEKAFNFQRLSKE